MALMTGSCDGVAAPSQGRKGRRGRRAQRAASGRMATSKGESEAGAWWDIPAAWQSLAGNVRGATGRCLGWPEIEAPVPAERPGAGFRPCSAGTAVYGPGPAAGYLGPPAARTPGMYMCVQPVRSVGGRQREDQGSAPAFKFVPACHRLD
jgi:hypothetical protein